MPLAQTVARLRRIVASRGFVVSTARECQSDPKRFWASITAEHSRITKERRTASLTLVLGNSGPVGLAGLSHVELARLVKGEKARDALQSWAGESLLVLGPTGVGKTALCVALVGSAHASKNSVWCSGESLLLSQRRHPLGQGEPPEYERAVGADLLVVDDPDWIRSRDADELFALVCAGRERQSRPMLVTSGATQEEFVERYGMAVVRRILESSRGGDGRGTGRIVDCHQRRIEG